MAFKRVLMAAALAAGFAAAVPAAAQASVLIHGYGDFVATALSDPLLGGPGDHFDFTLVVPETFTPIADGGIGARTYRYADFSYRLNSVLVDGLDLVEVGFYSVADGGGMELAFDGRNLEIEGDDFGSTGTVAAPFHNASIFSLSVDLTTFDGYAAVDTQLSDIPVSGGVPEPATWTAMIMGFGLAGAALRRRTLAA